jgi:hypothetical protein
VVGGSVGRGFGGETTDATAGANAGKTRGRLATSYYSSKPEMELALVVQRQRMMEEKR